MEKAIAEESSVKICTTGSISSDSIPPLRERKEDIPMLVNYFLKKLAACNEDQA